MGERAAYTASRLWPNRYRWNEEGSGRERLLQRHAMANAWRARVGQPPLEPPALPVVDRVPPSVTQPLLDAWVRAVDEGERAVVGEALLEAGLGVVPALREARDALGEEDARRVRLDLLVRRAASILREVSWAPTSVKPSLEFAARVEGARGKPVTGAWITGLWGALARGEAGAATSLDLVLTRLGDDTGAVVVLELGTGTTSWVGTTEGWILAASGLELVDDAFLRDSKSWWHDCRGPQLNDEILLHDTQEVRLRRMLTKVR